LLPIHAYETTEKIYESSSSIVYKAIRRKDDLPVVVKFLNEHYPERNQIARFRQEYQIASSMQTLAGVITVHSLEKHLNSLAIVMEDFGAESLEILFSTRKPQLKELLSLAVQVTRSLGEIHSANVIHKDINPSNIVLCPESRRLKIIDFGISTSLPREILSIANPATLEGTLAYLSPEQTGRGNRSVDYRADYYSLGATLYHLLTGRPPFETSDPLEMLHCHLARKPPAPHEIDPEIPREVSEVVLKLLSKDAEDRYQSAVGIAADLEECRDRLGESEWDERFVIASRDIPEKFCLPQRLYGRDREIKAIIQAYKRVCTGTNEIMLLTGRAGVGKTALANEISRSVPRHQGYLIRGKFDQLQGTEPYTGLVMAFQDLVQQILTEPDSTIARWRNRLTTALGAGGRVITSVIPDLERIIGEQPELPQVGLTEARNRFVVMFQQFVQVFCDSDHPLIVLLDDLQWADLPSLDLLKLMMNDKKTKYLFILGAYRDDEVRADHPLAAAVEWLEQNGLNVNNLSLTELRREDVATMIEESFRTDREASLQLATILDSKTSGNPLALREFLTSLHTENLLDFDSVTGTWRWDLEQIRNRRIVDNVVPLMTCRIEMMGRDTQLILAMAGLMGNRFDLQSLASASERSAGETLRLLWPAIAENLIVFLGPSWKSIELDDDLARTTDPVEFQFSHDRIQQAAYSMIPATEHKAMHRKIGKVLLDQIAVPNHNLSMFNIVRHLNLGFDPQDQSLGGLRLAELNLLAGEKAKISAAYSSALDYLHFGITLLGGQAWEKHYELTFDLHIQAAESAYLAGDFDEMRRTAEVILSRARAPLDKVRVHEIEIQADVAQNRTAEAIRTGLSTLRMLGMRLPEKPKKLSILLKWLLARWKLAFRPTSRLAESPPMVDPEKLAAMRILACLASAAYVTVPELVPLIAFKTIHLSLKYGIAPATAYGLTGLGLVQSSVMGDIEGGYRLGNLALALVGGQTSEELKAKTMFAVNCFLRHWKEHIRETLAPLLESYRRGLETGDLECAAVSAFIHSRYSYFAGRNLTTLEREMEAFGESLTQLNQESPLHTHRMTRQAVLNLMDKSAAPYVLEGEAYNEREMLDKHVRDNDARSLLLYHFNKLTLSYLFERYDDAVNHLDESLPFLDKGRGTHTVCMFNLYGSLAMLALADQSDPERKRRVLQKVKKYQRALGKWAQYAPMNNLHRFYLVEAERFRVLGKTHAAADYFDRAIHLARENRYLNEEALANEIAGRFYFGQDRPNIGKAYIEQARYCYELWGAAAKVAHLDGTYFYAADHTGYAKERESVIRVATTTPTSSSHPRDFDVESVVKASHVISSEIKLETLLVKLVDIMMENAGADRCFIILEKDGKLGIEAEAALDAEQVHVLQSQPIEERDDLAVSMINYVARTRETISVDDPGSADMFMNDPYISQGRAKSILCMPVIFKGTLSGLLYLENKLTSGAFTIARSKILGLLCGQAAISLENAKLYERIENYAQTLERRVQERTNELAMRNEAMQREIQERLRMQEALRESEARFRNLAELLPQYVFEMDNSGYLSFLNRAAMEMSGYDEQDLERGLQVFAVLAEGDRERAAVDFRSIMDGGTVDSEEYKILRKDGSTFPAIAYVSPIAQDTKIVGARGVCVDISQLKSVQQKLKSSLEEKETLMREIHHRVKNNLQVMSSLIRLQARHVQGDANRSLFEEAQHRIRSMALVHEKLYMSETLAAVPMKDYVTSLVNHLLAATGRRRRSFCLTTNIGDLTMVIETAVPVGFILTELVSNCLKHAFPGDRDGNIRVHMRRDADRELELIVADDGVGMPEDFEPSRPETLGWELVNIFCRQLDAQIEILREPGTEVRVRFSESAE